MVRLRRREQAILAVALVALVAISSVVYLRLSLGGVRPTDPAPLAAEVASSTASVQISRYISEYTVGGPNSQPNAIAADSKGDIWFTLAGDDAIAELTPGNGTTREFGIPHENGSLVSSGIAVDDAKGLVWFTDQLGNSVWSLDVVSHAFTRYGLPEPLSAPYQVAVDGSGNVWFTEIDGGRIGEITGQGAIKEYAVPAGASAGPGTALVGPAGIAIGPGGAVWFTEVYLDSVGSLQNGTFHQYRLAGASSPTGIALDQQGNVWVTLHGGSDIAELDPSTNATRIISTSIPVGVQSTLPYFVVVDPHGNVWFNEHYGNAIARFTPSNQTLVEYEVPTKVASLGNLSGALSIGLDAQGHPWFTEFYTGKVGTVDQGGALGLQVSVTPTSNGSAVDLPEGGTASASVQVQAASPTTLSYAEAGGPNLQITFSQSSGDGSYSSTMTLTAPSGMAGGLAVDVTISAVTPDLVCSQVIDVET